MIVIVDYGMGNLASIANMLKKVGVKSVISRDPSTVSNADKLILPGVGAFDTGMRNLREYGLIAPLNVRVLKENAPVLGVCLGMQLLGKKSEEGTLEGLGWIDAETIRFKFQDRNATLKIPHMGWNTVNICRGHPLFEGLELDNRFYFVHSYHVVCNNSEHVLTKTNYGFNFNSSIVNKNIMAVQFHPEKSHKFGMQFLKNFAEIV